MEHFSLTANNIYAENQQNSVNKTDCDPQAHWRSVALDDLALGQEALGNEANETDFWPSRHEEYNRLEWDRMDWGAVRRELGRAAAIVDVADAACPELEFIVPSMRERTFLEMWFGYGDPSVEACPDATGRLAVGYGKHRIRAVADYPMSPRDRSLMRLPDTGFTPDGPLPGATRIPLIVHAA